MMTIGRCAGLTALALLAVAAFALVGCGGGGEGVTPAQTGSVSGTIVHAGTGLPLGDVQITVGGISATTNASGQFTVNGVPIGLQVVTIQVDPDRGLVVPPGVDLSVTVVGGQTTQLAAPINLIDAVDVPPSPPS